MTTFNLIFNKIKNNPIWLILIIAFLARMIFMFLFTDLRSDYYWEYGDIAKYILDGKGYSFVFFNGNDYEWGYQVKEYAYPSAFMPPGYVFFLIPFLLIKNLILRNILFFTVQAILSTLCSYFIFKFSVKYFSKNIAIISALIYAVLPEFIYASNIAGPTIIYHLGVILIFYMLSNKEILNNLKGILILCVSIALLIYFRSEFAFYSVFIFFLLLYHKKFKNALIFVIVIWSILLPWQIRNFMVFDEFIPLTTNSGLNFYRGHCEFPSYQINKESNLEKQIVELKTYKNFEQLANKMYMKKGLDYAKNNPLKEFIKGFSNVFYLWTFVPEDKRSSHPLYLIPWFVLLLFSIIGIVKTFSIEKFIFVYLFLIYHSTLAFVLFPLPRYQTLMKVALIPFAAYGVVYIFDKLIKKLCN
jgi:hypothetical protein